MLLYHTSGGGSQPIATCKLNITGHLASIDVSSLPKTLRDAVEVTVALGLRYLWIDALCIVQDSAEDTVEELRQMKHYYREAFCVIAASRSGAAKDGFLDLAAPPTSRPWSLEHTSHEQNLVEIPYIDPSNEVGLLYFEADPKEYSSEENPLHHRCWTFQERLLCPRVLQFPEVIGFAMECDNGEQFAGNIIYKEYTCRRLMQPPRGEFKRSTDDIHESWLQLVYAYGSTELTYPGDKLIALAALVEEYHVRNGTTLGRYLAGDWSEHIVESLQWQVANPEPRPPY